ncbi:hypothetical protein S40293_10279 [Stachybotrys chartarum IBT 40293]|nr:hypothetical protein S40293_10279 [Stachybotrys chartarum IBT 40293]
MVRSSLVSLLATASAALAPPRSESSPSNIVPGAYIVEFDGDANANQFRIQAEPEYETRLDLDFELFRGVSIQLSDVETAEEQALQLASLPAVKNIWPVKTYGLPEPVVKQSRAAGARDSGSASNRFSAHKRAPVKSFLERRQASGNGTSLANSPHTMTQVDKLHAQGITGEGITIAVIDTGIDYHHPALGGCFGEGCLVAYGHDLVGDDYTGYNTPVPDDDPDDCYGHGTHVAGTISALENPLGFTGAAPGVTLAAYRVIGCRGSAGTDVLIAAFNRAYEEGADIITASIGGPSGWSSEPWAVAVSRIVERGVPCTVAAGNGGAGLFDTSTAADGKGVTAIASFDNTHTPYELIEGFYTIDDGPSTSFGREWGYPYIFDGVEHEVWVTGYDLNNTWDACDPLPDETPDLSEFIVLLRWSDCEPYVQAINVAAKGARFLALYMNRTGIDWIDVEYFEGTENILGATTVLQPLGESWVRALQAGSVVRATFPYFEDADVVVTIFENEDSPGAVSWFSSWGPTFEMDFKPQFGAPGGDIMSTYPLELGSYAVASGTSMATPLAAAAYALIAQARGTKPHPELFENLLASTANAQLFQWFSPFQDWLAPPAQQGAGLIQVYDAAYTTAYLQPSALSFNDTANFAETLNFTIYNEGTRNIAFDISHVPTHTLYTLDEDAYAYWRPGPNVAEYAELAFSSSKVTVAPGEANIIAVTATPPAGLDEARYPYWSGFIAVNGSDGSSLSLAYQGLSGSLHDAVTIPEVGGAFMGNSLYPPGYPLRANTTFTLPTPGNQVVDPYEVPLPVVNIDMTWGSLQVTADVVPLRSCASNSTVQRGTRSIGQVQGFPAPFMPRGFFYWLWFGQLDTGDFAPAGRYKIVVRALRIFGDPSNEDDWIERETIPFAIRYNDYSA